MKYLLLVLLSLNLISCGGGSSNKKVGDDTQLPFSVNVNYDNEAVAKQPINIKLSPSQGYTIESSEFITSSELSLELTKISESEYQLIVPDLFLPQSLEFQINATADNGNTTTIDGSITYRLNHYPTFIDYMIPEEAEELSTITIELQAEDVDGHKLEKITLTAIDDNIDISRLSDNSFSVTLPDVIFSQFLSFTAQVTDEFQKNSTKTLSVKTINDEPFFDISGLEGILTNSSEYYSAIAKDLSEGIIIKSVLWQQLSGPIVTINSPNSNATTIYFPSTQAQENIRLSAQITLTNDEVHTVTKDIVTLKNLSVHSVAIDNNVIAELFEQRSNSAAELDINQDGLLDSISIESGIIYVQYQTTGATYQNKEKIAELSFHQWLSNPSFVDDLETLRAQFRDYSLGLVDMNNDGLLDLTYVGRMVSEEHAVSTKIEGWIKGVSNKSVKYEGDFLLSINEFAHRVYLEDINFDNFPDLIVFDSDFNTGRVYAPYILYGTDTGFDSRSDYNQQIIKFSNQNLNSISGFGDLYGNGEKNILTLVSTNHEWESGGKSWIKIHTLNNTTKTFNQDVSIYLDTKATRVDLIDVTGDGIDDILYYDAQAKNYRYIESFE